MPIFPICTIAIGTSAVLALTWGCGEKPRDPAQIALGQKLYAQHCAACHGAKLEGQANWRQRLPNGRMPAPPHDESGHTWHHTDRVLFGVTKNGLVPPYAPQGYESDMPAFAGKLSDDEIRAVLAYIKSYWTSPDILAARAEIIQNEAKR
jgi:mono/diheme cytochrome c family protein